MMNNKMLQRAANILVESGYAKETWFSNGEGHGADEYQLGISTFPNSTIYAKILLTDPFADTLEGRRQLDILEKYYRINTQQNSQGDVNTSDLDGVIKSGGASPRYGRISCVESCLRNDTKILEDFKTVRKTYADFVGIKILYVIDPYQFSSEHQALAHRLEYYIKEELDYYNGLICDFGDVKTEISAGMVIVSGTVTLCEVNSG